MTEAGIERLRAYGEEQHRMWDVGADDEADISSSAALLAADLAVALCEIQTLQPQALEYIRRNGFVFDDIGVEPGNWKHLAFSLYTELCVAESVASDLLARVDAWGTDG